MVAFQIKQPPPIRAPRPDAERIEQLVTHLRQEYPAVDPMAIRVVKVPLRICPLGAHIDHQLGLVTGMTLDQSIFMAFAPAPQAKICLSSLNFTPPISFELDSVPPYQPGDWGNYIRGAVLALQRDHPLKVGLTGVIGGEMPIGGLSSSAAATIAYLLALESLNELALSPETNVSLVRFTENQYIGLNNGILDQSVILFSALNQLTRIDCQTMQIDRVPTTLQPGDFEILVVYSGLTRALVGTSYNNRVAECQEAASALLAYAGQKPEESPRLGLVAPAIFEAEGHRLPELLWKRANHYFGEMRRVQAGVEAWQSGNLSRFGELMNESGESSITYYECGSPQLITLYETLRQTPGVYGARFSGAGFRGNCIALIDPAARDAVAEAIHRRYPAAHPAEAGLYSIHFCRPDGQARLIEWSR
jgi:galactokinase